MRPPISHRKRLAPKLSSYSLTDELMASTTAQLSFEDRRRRVAGLSAALKEITHADKPMVSAWTALRDAVYIMETLIVDGEAPVVGDDGRVVASSWCGCAGERIEVADSQRLLQDAMAALSAAGMRVLDGKVMRLDGVGIQAVRSIIEDFQGAVEALPARTMIRCFRKADARIREHIHQRVKVSDAFR